MLTSKQRAYLRGLANGIDTILYIGKGEITENIIQQADDAARNWLPKKPRRRLFR